MPSNNFSITLLWNKRARESESLLSNNILQLTTSNYECNVLISTCLSVWRYFLFEVKTSVSSLVSLFPCWSWWLTWGFLLLWRQCGYDPTLIRKSKSKVQARFLIQKLILKKGARFKYRTTFTLKASAWLGKEQLCCEGSVAKKSWRINILRRQLVLSNKQFLSWQHQSFTIMILVYWCL